MLEVLRGGVVASCHDNEWEPTIIGTLRYPCVPPYSFESIFMINLRSGILH